MEIGHCKSQSGQIPKPHKAADHLCNSPRHRSRHLGPHRPYDPHPHEPLLHLHSAMRSDPALA